MKSLRDQLLGLVSEDEDSGFPILRQDDGGPRMVGYIGANELEHALSELPVFFVFILRLIFLYQVSWLMKLKPPSRFMLLRPLITAHPL